mgnify:CR=1 FL=1
MTTIELFPCSGGMAEGFRRAGIVFDLAFDWDAEACASYEANLGRRPVQLDVRDLVRMVRAGWSPGHTRLLVADPPCTPWSRAGKRQGLDDDRDTLAPTCDLVQLLAPDVFVIGNIPGLDDAPNAAAVDATIGALRRRWCVHLLRINAADYGVPQVRVRPFWIGHRAGPCPVLPPTTHADPEVLRERGPALPGFERLLPWVTVREALAGLPPEQWGRPVRLRHEGARAAPRHPPNEIDAPANTVGASDGGGSKRALRLRTPQSARAASADAPGRSVDARPARAGTGDSGVLAWPWDRPATTLDSRDVLAPPGRNGRSEERGGEPQPQRAHPDAIALSEAAAAILQGFPTTWQFVGKTKASRWSQIGMAVPPAMAEAVGRAVAKMLART